MPTRAKEVRSLTHILFLVLARIRLNLSPLAACHVGVTGRSSFAASHRCAWDMTVNACNAEGAMSESAELILLVLVGRYAAAQHQCLAPPMTTSAEHGPTTLLHAACMQLSWVLLFIPAQCIIRQLFLRLLLPMTTYESVVVTPDVLVPATPDTAASQPVPIEPPPPPAPAPPAMPASIPRPAEEPAPAPTPVSQEPATDSPPPQPDPRRPSTPRSFLLPEELPVATTPAEPAPPPPVTPAMQLTASRRRRRSPYLQVEDVLRRSSRADTEGEEKAGSPTDGGDAKAAEANLSPGTDRPGRGDRKRSSAADTWRTSLRTVDDLLKTGTIEENVLFMAPPTLTRSGQLPGTINGGTGDATSTARSEETSTGRRRRRRQRS